MKRLDPTVLAVAEVCKGWTTPTSALNVRAPRALMTYLCNVGEEAPFNVFETLGSLVAICNAIVKLANNKQISVACARAFHYRFFSGLLNRRENPRTYWIYVGLFYDKQLRGVFDLGGITVQDEEFHFATPDFEQVTEMVFKIIREGKIAKMKPNVAKWLIDMEPPKKPLPIYYHHQHKPGRYGYEHLS